MRAVSVLALSVTIDETTAMVAAAQRM